MKEIIFKQMAEAISESSKSPNQELVGNGNNELTILIQDYCEKISFDFSENIYKSLKNILMSPFPSGGLALLKQSGVLDGVFPEYGRLYGVPQVEIYHPEIDTGIHLAMCVDYAAKMNMPWHVRFAVFCHDFGKGITPPEILPHHYDHEVKGTDLVKLFCAKWGTNKAEEELALFVTEHHGTWHRAPDSGDKKIAKFLMSHDLHNKDDFRIAVGLACIADSRGRLGLENSVDSSGILFDKICDSWKKIDPKKQLLIAEEKFNSYLKRKEERGEEASQTINYFLDDLIYREKIRLVSGARPKKSISMAP